MRFVFTLLLLFCSFMFNTTAFAVDVTQTASVSAPAGDLFFEPTAEQASTDWKALHAQHEAYLEAKEAGDWSKARELALFHFTRAWAFNNEAFEKVTGAWDDADLLLEVQALYEKALAECDLAEKKGRYLDEVKDCRLKATRTLKSVKERLTELSK